MTGAALPVPVSLAQAARQFRVGPQTVRRSLSDGNLPGYRLGYEWVLFRDEINWWIARQLGAVVEPLDPLFAQWANEHRSSEISEAALVSLIGKNRHVLAVLHDTNVLLMHHGQYRISDLTSAMRWN